MRVVAIVVLAFAAVWAVILGFSLLTALQDFALGLTIGLVGSLWIGRRLRREL
jgi:hypothetical protein